MRLVSSHYRGAGPRAGSGVRGAVAGVADGMFVAWGRWGSDAGAFTKSADMGSLQSGGKSSTYGFFVTRITARATMYLDNNHAPK